MGVVHWNCRLHCCFVFIWLCYVLVMFVWSCGIFDGGTIILFPSAGLYIKSFLSHFHTLITLFCSLLLQLLKKQVFFLPRHNFVNNSWGLLRYSGRHLRFISPFLTILPVRIHRCHRIRDLLRWFTLSFSLVLDFDRLVIIRFELSLPNIKVLVIYICYEQLELLLCF